MKKKYKGMRSWNSLGAACCILLATASNAFANSGPAVVGMAMTLAVVCLMLVLTLAGGGNVVLERLQAAKYPKKATRILKNSLEFIAGVALFIAGGVPYLAVIVLLCFSVYAIARGVKMMRWSREAGQKGARPAHLEGVSPKRLKIAGIMLIALTLLVLGYSMINLEQTAGMSDSIRHARSSLLNYDAKKAHAAAKVLLEANPKAGVVTCEDMVKAGFNPTPDVTCFSDMTATSGSIRLTGPEKWKLKKPVAVITYAGKLTPAEP